MAAQLDAELLTGGIGDTRQGRFEGVDVGGGAACVIAGAVAGMGEHRFVAVVGALQTAQPLHFGVHGGVLQQQRVARTDRFGFCGRECG